MKWILTKEKNRLTIRKSGGGRYPREKYKDITSQRELENLVMRLNGQNPDEERAKTSVSFKHAFIDPALLDRYFIFLKSRVPKYKETFTLFNYLKNYALNFFIGNLNLANPLDWHKQQDIWSMYLLNTDSDLDEERLIFYKDKNGKKVRRIMSGKVLKATIYELNRFLEWLHYQRPEEVGFLKLNPISESMYDTHEAIRKNKGLNRDARYITPAHWKLIEPKLTTYMRVPALLSLYYGLRRNETLGLLVNDVKNGHLSVERQWGGEILKDKENRKVPHWFCTPKEARALIESIPEIHPDTISSRFSKICADLNLPPYIFHDIRRTFITNAVKAKIEPEQLRLAMGHSTIDTTYRYYIMDSRELADEVYDPNAA